MAKRNRVRIPHLCHKDGLDPVGNCRSCMVEINGERVLAPSCCRAPSNGMVVQTASERARKSQQLVLELLQADMPETALTRRNEVDFWAEWLKVGKPRFAPRPEVVVDASHPAIAVDLNACIQCTRCLRACRDEQMNDVIGLALRGEQAKIVFDMDDPMGASTCVACGECVQACPTGALAPAREAAMAVPDKQVESVCPYCGVGCQLTYNVKDNKILFVNGRDGPANHSRLCVKGRYGFDYAHHPQRLTKPLIRRADAPKRGDFTMDPNDVMSVFREATWDEALDLAGGTLKRLRDQHGRYALAGFGSAKGSNEEAYLFQKLVRTGFGSNNVDHCTRLCHASSVAALLEGIGSGAVSNPVMDVTQAEVVILIGANPTVNHPVAATWMKNAVAGGTKLIVMDPRRSELTRYAHRYLQFKADTDVALLNAMMHVIVEEGPGRRRSSSPTARSATRRWRRTSRATAPRLMAPICGIDADTIREVARLYATSKGSMILWGMGISQHVHGTDNARCLIALSLMTGQIGRPGTGLHPLRGQNNVQGASDAGLIPMMYPDYQRVDNKDAKARFASAWKVRARVARRQAGPHRGGGDQGDRCRQHQGHVHHGREPRDERPRCRPRARRAGHARDAGGAGHLPHRDRVPRRRDPAGLGVPREVRQLHQHRPHGAARPPGAAAAGPGAAGPVDHPPAGAAPRRALARLWARQRAGHRRGVRRDAPHDAEHLRHHVGSPAARAQRHLSVLQRRRRRAARWCSTTSSPPRPARPGSCRPI